jgi:dUTP pyrophosphatase
MVVEFKVLDPDILLYGIPSTESLGAAGYDLRANIKNPILIQPQTTVKLPTGIAISTKDRFSAAFIFARSGLAAKFSITLQNGVGVIDSDYQGELQVLLRNEGTDSCKVNPGDRIAQLVFMKVEHPMVAIVQDFTALSIRGEDGFGSTGVETRSLTDLSSEPSKHTILSGRELPTQSLGNDDPITVGSSLDTTTHYEPTGQALLESEYGED